MSIPAPVNREFLDRPLDSSAATQRGMGGQTNPFRLDHASLLGVLGHIHALGLAHLASGGSFVGQSDRPTTDQRASLSQEPPQAVPGGLLGLLTKARAPDLSPLVTNPAPGITDTMTTASRDTGRVADRTQQRYVSRITDQINGGVSNVSRPLLARGTTNCDNAYSFCLARLPDLRSRGKCDRLKILCDNGIDGIFGPGVAGSRRVE